MIIGSDHRTDDVLKSTVTLCLLHQQDMPARFARLRMDLATGTQDYHSGRDLGSL
jgi:hypothetical protein